MNMDSHSNPVEYAQMLIDEFEQSGLFESEPISKNKMHQHLLNASIKNLEERGDYRLNDGEALECYELAVRDYIDSCIAEALNDEILAIDGVDENGNLLYGMGAKAGEFIDSFEKDFIVATAKFEVYPGFGEACLN
jgi:hypothetical protein